MTMTYPKGYLTNWNQEPAEAYAEPVDFPAV